MATTVGDNLWSPDGTSVVGNLRGDLAAMQDSVQLALNKHQNYDYRWANVAARTAQTGMREGDTGYQADTKIGLRYRNGGWRLVSQPLTNYTPTFTSGVSQGNGVWSAAYKVSDEICTVNIVFALGSTTSVGGDVNISLPITVAPGIVAQGSGQLEDSGYAQYIGVVSANNNGVNIAFQYNLNNFIARGGINGTQPFTWVVNDKMFLQVSYPINSVST